MRASDGRQVVSKGCAFRSLSRDDNAECEMFSFRAQARSAVTRSRDSVAGFGLGQSAGSSEAVSQLEADEQGKPEETAGATSGRPGVAAMSLTAVTCSFWRARLSKNASDIVVAPSLDAADDTVEAADDATEAAGTGTVLWRLHRPKFSKSTFVSREAFALAYAFSSILILGVSESTIET